MEHVHGLFFVCYKRSESCFGDRFVLEGRHVNKVMIIIKGSLDEKLPSYEVLKMLKE